MPDPAAVKIADLIEVLQRRIERLTLALARIAEGDVPRPGGGASKHTRCVHGLPMYEDCHECVAEFVHAVLHDG